MDNTHNTEPKFGVRLFTNHPSQTHKSKSFVHWIQPIILDQILV